MAKARKPLPAQAWLAPRVRVTRALSLAFVLGLIALLVVNNLWFANLHGARVSVILAIELLPLLLVLPGMLSASARAHAWACFVVNIYFIKGWWQRSILPGRCLAGLSCCSAWGCSRLRCCMCAGSSSTKGAWPAKATDGGGPAPSAQ